jgi:hypothetical protein
MRANLRLYFAYLKNPVYLKNEKVLWSSFFKLFIIVFLLSLPLSIVSNGLMYLLHLQGLPHYFRKLGDLKLWEAIFFIPIIEETLFRLLLKPTFKNIVYFLVILSIPFVANLLRGKYYHALFFVPFLIVPLAFLLKRSYLKWVQKYFLKHFTLFFYLSYLIFGLLHITNLSPFSYMILLLAPLLVLPQLFAGTVLGFVRMKYGMVYSVLFHFLMNFPFLIGFLRK